MSNNSKECDGENCVFCNNDGTCKICSNGFILSDLNKCEPVSISTAEACNYIIK